MLTRDESHVYRWNERIVPGVTSIIEPLDELWRVPPDVLAAKADLGRRVHLASELDDAGDLDESSVEDDVAPYLMAWRQFKLDKRVHIVCAEEFVFHEVYRYGGQLDRVLEFDGMRFLVDIKTSAMIWPSARPQTAAYMMAKNDPKITRRAVIQLKRDGRYKFEEFTSHSEDWACFLSCLTIQNWKNKYAA